MTVSTSSNGEVEPFVTPARPNGNRAMSKRQAPDCDQQGHHGRNGKLRKRGRNLSSTDSNVEIIDVQDEEEEEDWFNMTMSKHTSTHSWQDDSHSGELRTYSSRTSRGARAERRKNLQDQQNELIDDDELMFDTQLQRALALSKQEAEKSTYQQQAEEEELQKILEQSKMETTTPVKAVQVEAGAGALLSPGAPVSPAQTETVTPVRPTRLKTGAPDKAMQVGKGAPVKPAQVETPAGAPVQPAQVETGAPVKPTKVKAGASVKPAQVETAAGASVRPTPVETGAPAKPAEVETAAGASVRPTQVETGAPVKPAKVETAAGASVRPTQVETGAPVKPAKVETAAGASVRPTQVETGAPAKQAQVETAAGASVRPTQVETGAPVKPAKLKTSEPTCVEKKQMETTAGAPARQAKLENGTPAQPAQSKTGADISSSSCNSHGHVEAPRKNKQQEQEEEKAKKHQTKVKRRRQICQDYMESGIGERWIKKRRVVYHHGNFVRRPGVDTSKQTKYIIRCLETYGLKLQEAQRRQLTKLEWGKPLEAEDERRAKSRRRKGTWTVVSGEEETDNSQAEDQNTKNGTLATLDKDNKDQTVDLDTFEFDNNTQNGTVSSAVDSQGHNHTIEPKENTANSQKTEEIEMPDSTSFDVNILDYPSPEHKPLTRSHSRGPSSPVVMGTPDPAESLEAEEATQASTSLPDKSVVEDGTGTSHQEEDVTMTESQENALLHDEDDQSTRRVLRPRSTKQLKITDVVLTDDSEKSDNDTEDSDFLSRIARRINLKRRPLHRQGRNTEPVLKQARIDQAVRNGTASGSTVTASRTEAISEERVMQSCFICGKEVPEDELQEHINNELDNST